MDEVLESEIGTSHIIGSIAIAVVGGTALATYFRRRALHPLYGRAHVPVIFSQISLIIFAILQPYVFPIAGEEEEEEHEEVTVSQFGCYSALIANALFNIITLTLYGVRVYLLWASNKQAAAAYAYARDIDNKRERGDNTLLAAKQTGSVSRRPVMLASLFFIVVLLQLLPFLIQIPVLQGDEPFAGRETCHLILDGHIQVESVINILWAIILTYSALRFVKIDDTFHLKLELITVSFILIVTALGTGIPLLIHLITEGPFPNSGNFRVSTSVFLFFYSLLLPTVHTFKAPWHKSSAKSVGDDDNLPKSLPVLLEDPNHRRGFQSYLLRSFCVENMLFYDAVGLLADNDLESDESADKVREQMEFIYTEYVCDTAKFQVNISFEQRELIEKHMKSFEAADPTVFASARAEVFALMNSNCFDDYIASVRRREQARFAEKKTRLEAFVLLVLNVLFWVGNSDKKGAYAGGDVTVTAPAVVPAATTPALKEAGVAAPAKPSNGTVKGNSTSSVSSFEEVAEPSKSS